MCTLHIPDLSDSVERKSNTNDVLNEFWNSHNDLTAC